MYETLFWRFKPQHLPPTHKYKYLWSDYSTKNLRGAFLFYCSPFKWTKRKGKNEIFIFRFSPCASRTRESLLDVSQTSNRKEKPQNFQNRKRNGNLKFFLSESMDPNTALELVKQGVTLLLLDVPQYTLVGIDTQVLYSSSSSSTSFFCLLLLIFIHQSIDQCGRCFLLGLLLRASRWFLLLLIFFIIVHPPG